MTTTDGMGFDDLSEVVLTAQDSTTFISGQFYGCFGNQLTNQVLLWVPPTPSSIASIFGRYLGTLYALPVGYNYFLGTSNEELLVSGGGNLQGSHTQPTSVTPTIFPAGQLRFLGNNVLANFPSSGGLQFPPSLPPTPNGKNNVAYGWFLGVGSQVIATGYFVDVNGLQVGSSWQVTIPAGGSGSPVQLQPTIPSNAVGAHASFSGNVYYVYTSDPTDFTTNYNRYLILNASAGVLTIGNAI